MNTLQEIIVILYVSGIPFNYTDTLLISNTKVLFIFSTLSTYCQKL